MSDPAGDVERLLRQRGLLAGDAAAAVTSPAVGHRAWASGYLPDGSPVDAASSFYAASIAKQVVATLAAQAVLDGALGVDAPLRSFFPALPGWGATVRLRHLIHHTSGLPATARVVAALGLEHEAQLDNDLVLEGLARLGDPDDGPGRRFVYSNIGYVALAEVVRVVSGLPLADAARRLFDRLAMTSAHLGGAADVVRPDRAPPPQTIGDGGLWISADDLLRWLDGLNTERLGTDLTRLVQTPGRLDDGTPLSYAWGMTARPGAGGTTYTHGGNWPGWTAKTVRNPTTRTAVALVTGNDDIQLVSGTAEAVHARLVAT